MFFEIADRIKQNRPLVVARRSSPLEIQLASNLNQREYSIKARIGYTKQ